MRKKGISLVSISIAVIVMLVLVSTISVSLTFSITNAKKMTFAKEIYNIQSLVDEYVEREETLPPTLETIQITPSDLSQFNLEKLSNGTLLLETLDLPSLDIKSTSYGNKEIGEDDTEKAKDVYAVSLATGKVYYIAGFEIAGKKYYTLTDELRQMIEKKQNLTVGEKTVTFTPSVVGWGKDGISVTVAVPSEFTSPSLEISNTNIKYTSTTANGVVYYNVNTEKVAENYTITVNYTKGGVVSSATYTAKIDKTAPVISKDTSVSNVIGKVNGLKATDTESGIKYFKYAEGVISLSDAKSYMKAYGKNITNGSINFKNRQNYTLYAEDKAGNYSIIYVDVTGAVTSEVMPIGATITGYKVTVTTYTTDGSENTASSNYTETNPQPQTITANTDITWKYMGTNENGEIEIVAELSSVNEVADNTKTTLGGKGGYLNGAKALNTICKNLYSVSGVGTARSMNIDDVIELLEYTGTKGLYLDSDGNYVETAMPLTVGEIDNKLGTSLGTQTTTPDGKALSTYKSDYFNIDKNNEDTNADKTSLACNAKNNYWLASTCVYANFKENCASFYLRYVGGHGAGGRSLFFSEGTSYINTYAIRPVVSLDQSVQLVKDTSATNTWKIQ